MKDFVKWINSDMKEKEQSILISHKVWIISEMEARSFSTTD
jgi:hypothetical protein